MTSRNVKFATLALLVPSVMSLVAPGLADASIPQLKMDRVHLAEANKTNTYIKDGTIVGGDRAIDDVIVLDIRHAANPDYERIVLDLEGNRSGEPAAINRAPYYSVSVTPDMKRLVVTLFGKPKLAFSPRKVVKNFRKSSLVEKLELLPIVEKDRWTFVMNMKGSQPVEVFELSNPVRVILDLKKK